MKIYLESLNGKRIVITINGTNTIYELKRKYGDLNISILFDGQEKMKKQFHTIIQKKMMF